MKCLLLTLCLLSSPSSGWTQCPCDPSVFNSCRYLTVCYWSGAQTWSANINNPSENRTLILIGVDSHVPSVEFQNLFHCPAPSLPSVAGICSTYGLGVPWGTNTHYHALGTGTPRAQVEWILTTLQAGFLILSSDWVQGKNRETSHLALHSISQTGTNLILMEILQWSF